MGIFPADLDARLREEVASRGLTLLDLRRRGQMNTTVMEVIVDAEERDVTLDEITELSRWLSSRLDELEESVPGRYRLEVSTGGLDRPLEHSWQFRKNVGRLLKLTFEDESGKKLTETYRLVDLHDDSLSVLPYSKKPKPAGEPFSIPLARISKAVVEPEF
jgi:ribosome maturation factor RimP